MDYIRGGDDIEKIYSQLFKQYYSKMLFYAMRFLNEEEAEDVVQDVFLELWNRRYSIEMGDHISSFLYKSVYFKALNVIKHQKIEGEYSKTIEDIFARKLDYYNPDNNEIINRLESRELYKEIKSVIDILPDKCRKVFVLSYIHDMKNKEIADVLDISLRTVEAHMYKALKLLKTRLKHLLLILLYFLFGLT